LEKNNNTKALLEIKIYSCGYHITGLPCIHMIHIRH
jgi:hypothetical protein